MSGTYTVVPSLVTRALEIGLSQILHVILQPTTSADGCITLFALWHHHFSHSIELHLLSCIRYCLQSLLAWRKVLFGNVYLQSNLYRVGPPKHHLGQLVSNLLCQAFLALSLPQPCEPPYLYMGPHLVYLDQIMARMLLIDRTCCASSPKGSRCHSSIQVKLLCKTLI